MEGFISDEFALLISKIPENDFDDEHVFNVFREYIPFLASKYNIRLCTAMIVEPTRGIHGNVYYSKRKVSLFDDRDVPDIDEVISRFEIGNGGYVEIHTGIDRGVVWTSMMKKDVATLSKVVFLLVGRARAMGSLKKLTFSDSLTGVPNEAGLNQYISMLLEKDVFDKYCSNFLNIKNMKLLNNKFGDRGGDRLIIMYAHKIRDYVGTDGVVARLGGDNFFVIISKEREQAFQDFITSMSVELNLPDGSQIPVKIDTRIGYYYIQKGDRHLECMRNSDVALSEARTGEKGSFVQFELAMGEKMLKIKQIDENFPGALENDEFVVYYQPKAVYSSNDEYELCGVEALVRWKKDHDLVAPGVFIPALENNGLVTRLDFYVFERVCKDIRELIDQGVTPVRVSSNFSRRHLMDSNFVQKIEAIIEKYKIDPNLLEIEITEAYDVDDMEALADFESRMHSLGINVSIDDFGSGFSSIKMVKNIMADTIKLDRSIIIGVGGDDPKDEVVIGHVIKMIKELGKDVIAEGVETETQAMTLRKHGCDMIQGYLFGRPIPKDEFIEKYYKK